MKQTVLLIFALHIFCLPALCADAVPAESLLGVDFVFFGPDSPKLLRFNVTVDNQPVEQFENRVLTELFDLLDQDKDGVLSNQERALLPAPRTLTALGVSPSGRSSSRQLLKGNARGTVKTKENLKTYLQDQGLTSLSASSGMNSNASRPLQSGHLLFQALDLDQDNQLTQAELKVAAHSLRKADINQDDLWAAREIVMAVAPSHGAGQRQSATAALVPISTLRPHLFAAECMKRYPGLSASPDVAEKNAPAKTPAPAILRLDRNQDGKLTEEEWTAFVLNPRPDMTFVLQCETGATPKTQLAILNAENNDSKLALKDAVELNFDPVKLMVTLKEIPQQLDEVALKKIFEQQDRNNNDYIERNEASGLRGVDYFDIDIDKDGKVFWEEYLAGMKPLFLMMSLNTRIHEEASGFDLFAAIHDGSAAGITLRELKNLPARMGQWDRNQDGIVSRDELPRHINVTLTRGLGLSQLSESGDSNYRNTSFIPDGRQRTRDRDQSLRWFTSMDQNQDGDLSRREFLGEVQLFEKLDVDGDGLISRTEAAAYR